MARTVTILEGDPLPYWARYAVVICHHHMRPVRPDRDVVQCFASRRAAETWAREVSRYFPARTGDELTLWALVYALGTAAGTTGYTFSYGAICYASYDPGATLLKMHEIPRGYGVPRPKPRPDPAACACCLPGGWPAHRLTVNRTDYV